MHVNLTIWYEALASEFGIVIETDDPEKCRQRLYALRKEANDPELDSIQLVQSPVNPRQLWVLKRKETK